MEQPDKIKLTNKQEAFCQEYVKDYNAKQAAIRVGYSEKTAKEIGCENLTKPNVSARIDSLRADIYKRNKVTVDEIVNGLGEMFRVDTTEIFKEDGSLKPLSEMTPRARKAIKNIKIQEYAYDDGSKSEKRTIELHDKLSAVEKLMKHLGGYEKDNQQQMGNITIVQLPDNGRT